MCAMRWNDRDDDIGLEDALDELLEEVNLRGGSRDFDLFAEEGSLPASDLEDLGEAFRLRSEIPGVKASSISIAPNASGCSASES